MCNSGIILEYEQAGVTKSKCIDLLDLGARWVPGFSQLAVREGQSSMSRFRSDVDALVDEIVEREPLVKQRSEQLQKLISSKKSSNEHVS